ncbi:MAG: UbiA family prenyltransferase [Ktedonobacteraceae bacterium]
MVLVLSLLPAILSSGAVISDYPSIVASFAATLAAVLYLLHIRIVDEHRDFAHDTEHHITRPIQRGLISKKELRRISIVSVIIFLGIAISFGIYPLLFSLIMLAYSYLAGKEFFIGEKIRQYFFFYNSVNLIQMLLLQLFVYSIFAGAIPLTILLATHFLFTTVGSVIFEFVRKLKIPGQDGTGRDTYTWYLGFNNSLIIYIFLLAINTLLCLRIITLVSPNSIFWLQFCFCLGIIAVAIAVAHQVIRTRYSDRLMQLSFLFTYGVFNIIIYFIKIH